MDGGLQEGPGSRSWAQPGAAQCLTQAPSSDSQPDLGRHMGAEQPREVLELCRQTRAGFRQRRETPFPDGRASALKQ